MNIQATTKRKIEKNDLYEISLAQANAVSKEVFAYENGEMSDLFDPEDAEEVRKTFLANEIRVKQITNNAEVPEFTKNDQYTNDVMTFRFVPREVLAITDETIIFDDIVTFYNREEICINKDQEFADSQKQLFMNIWDRGQSPKLNFEYKPNHSFYKNFDHFIGEVQVIVWPDADAKASYKGMSQQEVGQYLEDIITADNYFDDATYIIVFIWFMEGDKMSDIWKFNDFFTE